MTDCIVIPRMIIDIISLIMMIGGGYRLYYTIKNNLDDTLLNVLLFLISILCVIVGGIGFIMWVSSYIEMLIPCIVVI